MKNEKLAGWYPADPAFRRKFERAVVEANEEYLRGAGPDFVFEYPVRDFVTAFHRLRAVTRVFAREGAAPVLAPLGPKIFALTCFLVSTVEPDARRRRWLAAYATQFSSRCRRMWTCTGGRRCTSITTRFRPARTIRTASSVRSTRSAPPRVRSMTGDRAREFTSPILITRDQEPRSAQPVPRAGKHAPAARCRRFTRGPHFVTPLGLGASGAVFVDRNGPAHRVVADRGSRSRARILIDAVKPGAREPELFRTRRPEAAATRGVS